MIKGLGRSSLNASYNGLLSNANASILIYFIAHQLLGGVNLILVDWTPLSNLFLCFY